MKFNSYQIEVDGKENLSKANAESAIKKGNSKFRDGKMRYLVNSKMVEDRFLWISCDYDNVQNFNDIVVNESTLETQPNPRKKEQVEPRQQVFTLYDTENCILYISDLNRRAFVKNYLSDTLQKQIKIKPIYHSVEDFCQVVKTIKELRFVQVDNLISQQSGVFSLARDKTGLDVKELQVKVGLGHTPIEIAHPLLCRFNAHRDAYERVVVVGVDDNEVEHTFDYSSILKHIEIHPGKDENEHYDPEEVLTELLKELRNSGNV